MSRQAIAKVCGAARSSELLRAVALVRHDGGVTFALGVPRLRRLSADEVARLEAQGNTAEDWARVRVGPGFDYRRVRGCAFHGDVVVGRLAGRVRLAEGLELPAGLSASTLVDCVIGNDALVRDVRLLANYVIGEAAALIDCGEVTCQAGTTFGNGQAVSVGLEGGGREVAVYAELDVETAAAVAGTVGGRAGLTEYAAAVAAYCEAAASPRGIVERGARLRSTPAVRNVYVGPGARIDGATRVADSTLLSRPDEPACVESGAVVTRSLLQWGSRVTTLAVVERSVLAEHASAGRHAKVTDSILGPNTEAAAGEVTSCLLGPFVACHHQSLLIATLWPGGRGNVAYGANVGSNHTSRAPDQEFRPGEGMFLGLGVNVKFPADFTRSPYTVVACGADLLPQKVAFPFALIAPPSAHYPGVSPAYNEIIPGWMVAENLYALRRCEAKYRSRNRSRRATFDCRVFRPDTMGLVQDACRRLEAVRQRKEFYTERDIDGLGKNVLREGHRRAALDAYRQALRYYALVGLLEQLRAAGTDGVNRLLVTASDDPRWEHQRRLLVGELAVTDVVAALGELPALLERVARDVERSRVKDDERGRRVIDDYAEVHVPAGQDALVRQTWAEARRLGDEATDLVRRLERREAPAFPDHIGSGAWPVAAG